MSSRRVATRIAALGAAGAAAALFAAPVALADDAPPVDGTSDTGAPTDPGAPSDSGAPTDTPTDTDSSSSGGSSSAPAPGGGKVTGNKPQGPKVAVIVPNYGTQKIRTGIALKDGSWFPPGASLANATIHIVETDIEGDFVEDGDCTTDDDGFCDFPWFAAPGDTVTFTQTGAPDGPGVGIDPNPNVVGPCVNPIEVIVLGNKTEAQLEADPPECIDFPIDIPLRSVSGFHTKAEVQAEVQSVTPAIVVPGFFGPEAIFIDPPLPPLAADDEAVVHLGDSVTIAVLDNDTTFGAPTDVISVTPPGHGTVDIVGDQVKYTPIAPTGGPDTFSYTLETPNGQASASVHITVIAPPLAVDDSASTIGGDGEKGTPVDIDVLANDDAEGAPPLVLANATAPGHGTIEFTGDQKIEYTPEADFVGVDHFTYTITTVNGDDTAEVTVVVAAPPAGLAETGVMSGQMTVYALLLLLGGAGTAMAGRKYYQRQH